jgi:DNA polymerase-3 subunit alpha
VTDFEITSAVASLRTGISPYKRIDYLGKSFVTDGRTFIQIESHVPLQGFVLFNNGNPIEMKERILEVNRIFHGQIDRSFLAVGSKRENVVVKVRGTEKIIPGARPMGVDADKIIWR